MYLLSGEPKLVMLLADRPDPNSAEMGVHDQIPDLRGSLSPPRTFFRGVVLV
jgi:hypothetical protein